MSLNESINPSSSSTRNPFSSKLSQILSTDFADQTTRNALDTIGELEIFDKISVGAGADGISLKSANVGIDGVGGGGTGGGIGAAGVGLAARDLRKEVDIRRRENGRRFLEEFDKVNHALEALESHVDLMKSHCSEMEGHLERANESTKYLLMNADGLRKERSATLHQLSLTNLFLSRFTFTPTEVKALNSRDVPVGRSLFDAMDKCERIRRDCSVLLQGGVDGTGDTRAGYEILQYTSQHMEAGYQKIFKWCCLECRTVFASAKEIGALDVGTTMREAVKRLKGRGEMLSEMLTLLGTSRSNSLLSLFQQALSSGSAMSRPIELHAHDPTRYIADMLGWVHQAMAGEREFLEAIFGMRENEGGRWVGQARRPAHSAVPPSAAPPATKGPVAPEEREEDERRVRTLLDKALEGCARPLKIRVLQTIRSQEGSIMAYRIATLIHFYKVTMEKSVGKEALLSKVLAEITDNAYRSFFDSLESEGRSLLRFIQPPSTDLSPSHTLRDHLSVLREVMTVYESSLVDDEDRDSDIMDFQDVLAAALDPALLMCEKMGQMRTTGGEWDRSIWAINCLTYVQAVLQPFLFTKARGEAIDKEISDHVERLTREHYGTLLKESELEPLITAMDDQETKQDGTPLSHIPAASPRALGSAVRTFDAFLASVDTLSSSRLGLLLAPGLSSSIHRSALGRITGAYERVWKAVMKEENRYEFRSTVMVRSPEEVSTLLGVEPESAPRSG